MVLKSVYLNHLKKTFNIKQDPSGVNLQRCELCNQPTAQSPCNACKITGEISRIKNSMKDE